jgi:ethanolamine-phosphate cytidylyltransferase
VVGIVCDEQVIVHKGPPILTWEERAEIMNGCKWADEVVKTPDYILSVDTFNELGLDYVAHGDDPCYNLDGTEAYETFRSLGKFKCFKRTVGVSTTDIVGKLMSMAKNTERKSSNVESPITSSEIFK